jgi:hypothetical protein
VSGPGRRSEVSLTDMLLLAEAGLAVVAAQVLLATVGLRRLARWTLRMSSRPRSLGPSVPQETAAWAVNATAQRLDATCLPRALALQWLLARRGLPSELCIGLRTKGAPLPAHAWVEVDGRALGVTCVDEYATLCRLPGKLEAS